MIKMAQFHVSESGSLLMITLVHFEVDVRTSYYATENNKPPDSPETSLRCISKHSMFDTIWR